MRPVRDQLRFAACRFSSSSLTPLCVGTKRNESLPSSTTLIYLLTDRSFRPLKERPPFHVACPLRAQSRPYLHPTWRRFCAAASGALSLEALLPVLRRPLKRKKISRTPPLRPINSNKVCTSRRIVTCFQLLSFHSFLTVPGRRLPRLAP